MAVDPHIHIPVSEALTSANPLMSLRAAVAAELHQHHADRDEVITLLDEARLELRAEGRAQDEDVVTDVMDFVGGWCSPHMRI